MYTRLTFIPVRPATFTQLIASVREVLLPNSMTYTGFLGAQLLTRTRIDKAVLQTIWRTEFDAMQADEKGLLEEEMRILEPYASGPAFVEGYELSVLIDTSLQEAEESTIGTE